MDYYELLKWDQETGFDNEVTPDQIIDDDDDFILDSNATLKKDDLKKHQFLNPIRDYMVERKCVDYADLGADEVIEEVVSFPNGDHDDFCDSMTLALMRFRQGGFISLHGENEEQEEYRKKREYY